MKRFVLHIVVFIIPLLLLIIIFPVNKRLLYRNLSDDCFDHGIVLYDRIYNNPKDINIAFLGSSQTVNGIDDQLIESKLNSEKLKVANFGYCRYGVNLYYLFINELIRNKNLKAIVIEVREDENKYSHPVFPYIANNSDVLCASVLYNRDYFSDCYHHFYYKLEVLHKQIFHELKNKEIRKDDFGFAPKTDTAKLSELIEIKKQRAIPGTELSLTQRNFFMKYPRSYLEKIHRQCLRNNIRIIFLYIPPYGTKVKFPKENHIYQKYGTVLIPPCSLFENTNYWYDVNHLNQAGAEVFSEWIAAELKKLNLGY